MNKISRAKNPQALERAKAAKRSVITKTNVPNKEPLGAMAMLGYARKIWKGPARETSEWLRERRAESGLPPYQAPKPHDPVVWQGKDLSTDATIMYYSGKCYVRPLGRGVVLSDLKFEPHLDDVLAEGDYEVEIRVARRLPVPPRQSHVASEHKAGTDQTAHLLRSPSNAERLKSAAKELAKRSTAETIRQNQ